MKKMKKLLFSILAILMVVSLVPFSAMAVADDDQTTPVTTAATEIDDSGWIEINDAAEFLKIGVDAAYPVTGNYYLANDIDFSELAAEGEDVYKSTTGYIINTFCGNLDGRGNAIFGFEITGNKVSNAGFFRTLGAANTTTTIKNLTIGQENKHVSVSVAGNQITNFGILAGACGADQATNIIDNVHIYGDAVWENAADYTGNTAYAIQRIGGFVGYSRAMSITNCSFTGSISVIAKSAVRPLMGGILGLTETPADDSGRQVIIENCTVDADLSANYINGAAKGNAIALGGIIGTTWTSVNFIKNCTTKGTYSSARYATDDITAAPTQVVGEVGGIVGNVQAINNIDANYGNTILFVATDCVNEATLKCGTNGDVYGRIVTNGTPNYEERVYIAGCNSQNTLARDFGDFGEVDGNAFDPSYNYVWLIDEAADFAKIGTTDATNANVTYSRTGLYRIENDINFDAITNFVVTGHTGFVIDGNGKTINIKSMTKPFFQRFSDSYRGTNDTTPKTYSNDTVMFDLTFGSPTSYISYNSATTDQQVGILAMYVATTNKPKFTTLFNNVDIYANVTSNITSNDAAVGGFVGVSRNVAYYGCDMYGSVVSRDITKSADKSTRMGGFVGYSDNANGGNIFVNCNNFADVYVDDKGFNAATTTAVVHAGGFIGDVNANNQELAFVNSNNFGDVTVASPANFVEYCAGGLAGKIRTNQATSVLNCASFGNVSSTANAGGVAGAAVKAVNVSDLLQAGAVTGTTASSTVANAATLGCKSVANILAMDKGAAVRLAAETGLRYTATVSEDVMERLAEIEGVTVSYGIMIAPAQFVGDGEFTHAALDTFALANNFKEGEKAYVDVALEEWFKSEEGRIAGSITGIPVALYDTDFSGIAYMTITSGDVAASTIYAVNPKTRNIREVAKAALDDTSAVETVIGDYTYDKAIEVGEVYYENGVAKTFAEGDAAVYSCYPKSQRNILNTIAAATVAN